MQTSLLICADADQSITVEVKERHDLFSHTLQVSAPLAERLRPQSLADVIGQAHLLGVGKPLRIAFESGEPHSMILWGPPGSGKTTLARLMAQAFEAEFIAIAAVLAGVKEIREAIARAEMLRDQFSRRTIIFVDEVHRFNKAQQDAFLPHVESGLFTFIGATTENPSFEVNSALLSRAAVYVLQPLSQEELMALLGRALHSAIPELELVPKAAEAIVDYADGDARRLLNLLEQLEVAARAVQVKLIEIDLVDAVLTRAGRRFDKGGEQFYDQISALHKAVRGSHPDAALYWLCRMLDGGCDARYLARRMIRMAVEDIGLADPRALRLTLDAAETYERLGYPEGELALAEAALYLASADKSNATYLAYNAAMQFIKRDGSRAVPLHIRNAPTKLMKNLGYGKDYRYAHDETEAYAAGENYFPEGMPQVQWYRPTERGLEAKITERLAQWRELDKLTKKT